MPHSEAITSKRGRDSGRRKFKAGRQGKTEPRYSVALPPGIAKQVERYAETVNTSVSKAIAALVRLGLASQEDRKREFFKRLRENLADGDPKQRGPAGERVPRSDTWALSMPNVDFRHSLALVEAWRQWSDTGLPEVPSLPCPAATGGILGVVALINPAPIPFNAVLAFLLWRALPRAVAKWHRAAVLAGPACGGWAVAGAEWLAMGGVRHARASG